MSSRSPLWDRYPGQCDFSQKRSHKPLRDGTRPRSLLVFKVANVFFFPCLSNLPACRGFPDSFSFPFSLPSLLSPFLPCYFLYLSLDPFLPTFLPTFLLSYFLCLYVSLLLSPLFLLFASSLPTARPLLSSLLIFFDSLITRLRTVHCCMECVRRW